MIRILFTLILTGFITISTYSQSAHRYLLLEHFTNTRCPLCPSPNAVLHQTLENNPGVVHHISYHPSVPYNNCVLYLHNKEENNARKDQYGVSFTPQAFLGGTNSRVSNNLLPQATLDANLGKTSSLQVLVNEGVTSNGRSVDIEVRTYDSIPSGDIRLFAAIVERHLDYHAPNGETEHYNVFRKMLPSKNGEVFTPAAPGQSVNFSYQYTLDSEWDPTQMYVIAFVQNMNNDEVINAGTKNDLKINLSSVAAGSGVGSATVDIEGGFPPYSITWNDNASQTTETAENLTAGVYKVTVMDNVGATLSDTVRVEGAVSLENELDSKISVYPNPAGERIHVLLDGIEPSGVSASLYDFNGRRIQGITSERISDNLLTISVTNLPKGVYYLEVLVLSGRISRTIMID
ncbi:MAG: Omp28-related outer membrane protein [Bacteroidetes bacterium]|nr:Omp28-related outer membrane protein [Bacteroidota bacterium]MCB0843043.1 Omp28-related outer membrane protein [Bacteroidota bacterium]